MAKFNVKKGTTSRIEYVFVQDSSSTTGGGKTGLAYNTAGLTAYYARPGGSATSITLATQTVTGAYSSGGFVEVDATNMPGVYRFDVPDACFATGVDKCVLMLKGAANMAPLPLEYQLDDNIVKDTYDVVSNGTYGLAALDTDLNLLISFIKNKKYLSKVATTWYLVVRNSGDTADILNKALKDSTGSDISDLTAGQLAQELASSV